MAVSWREYEAWLDAKGLFHMDFGLGRIQAALAECGAARPPYLVVQVLGTNGKGSISAYIESLARAHGLKTGLFTSPHFLSLRERIRVNGAIPPEPDWLESAGLIMSLPRSGDLTYFEALTLQAALMFTSAGVDIAIFEAGLGGRHDATTALPASVHCFAPIAMDHASVIGPGLCDIANDKAGAIQPGACALSAPQYPEAGKIIQDQAAAKGATFKFAESLPRDLAPGLRGKYQQANAALALAAWREAARLLNRKSGLEAEATALREAFLPGRMQDIPAACGHPALLLDGAHNPHAVQALLANLPGRPGSVIFSALGDKNWRACLGLLARLGAPLIIPQLANERAADAGLIADCANSIRPGGARAVADISEALDLASGSGGFALVCGSLYLLAGVYNLFPQYLERKRDG